MDTFHGLRLKWLTQARPCKTMWKFGLHTVEDKRGNTNQVVCKRRTYMCSGFSTWSGETFFHYFFHIFHAWSCWLSGSSRSRWQCANWPWKYSMGSAGLAVTSWWLMSTSGYRLILEGQRSSTPVRFSEPLLLNFWIHQLFVYELCMWNSLKWLNSQDMLLSGCQRQNIDFGGRARSEHSDYIVHSPGKRFFLPLLICSDSFKTEKAWNSPRRSKAAQRVGIVEEAKCRFWSYHIIISNHTKLSATNGRNFCSSHMVSVSCASDHLWWQPTPLATLSWRWDTFVADLCWLLYGSVCILM